MHCPAWQILCVSVAAFVCNCNKETLLLLLLLIWDRRSQDYQYLLSSVSDLILNCFSLVCNFDTLVVPEVAIVISATMKIIITLLNLNVDLLISEEHLADSE